MKIDSFNVEQQAMSKFQRIERQQVNIQIQTTRVEDALDISEQGLSLNEVEEEPEDWMTDEDKRKIEMLEQFIQWLTGKDFKFKSVYKKDGKHERAHKGGKSRPKANQPSGAGFSLRIHAKSETYESERMKFSSSGTVKTADGREIAFDYNLSMSRELYESNELLIEAGDKFHDPLVMNFGGAGIDFSDKKIQIDIDLDGNLDNINFLSEGNGFLALDKNDNGTVDDGSELFGPQTNNGFYELSQYDDDQNMWIDENDDVFNSLKIWTIGDDGETTLIGLKEAGVGAIYLGDVSSEFTIKHGDEDMAKISDSSIYLRENGLAGGIHEVDIKL